MKFISTLLPCAATVYLMIKLLFTAQIGKEELAGPVSGAFWYPSAIAVRNKLQ